MYKYSSFGLGKFDTIVRNLPREYLMNICNQCGQTGLIVKPGLKCRKCVTERQNEWARKKRDRKCFYCLSPFIPNSISKECSLKCRLLNRIKEVNGCWEWQGKITNGGYGEITEHRKYMLAHRASYKTFKGEIPHGKQVCHTCDNRKCINPEHLWIGTAKENIADAKAKGRLSEQPMKKLSIEEVREIRGQLARGISTVHLASEYNVSVTLIWYIKHNKHYKEDDVSH
jgi:hypothetical protein